MTPGPSPLTVRIVLLLALAWAAPAAFAYSNQRVATDANGQPVHIAGSVVIVEPNIELTEVLAGGVQEPRREWSEAARRLYPAEVHRRLAAAGTRQQPDFDIPDALPPESRLGQVLRLNDAVSMSVLAYTTPGNELATKRGKQLDWTLGPGVEELRRQTGADYALFTYIRDSYTSGGRAAMRIIGFLLLGGDVGGGMQIGLASLVDLRTGQVVWHNLLLDQTGDLRDPAGAHETAGDLLKGIRR